MGALEKVLRNYRRRKYLEQNVTWISRQDASHILNVSIQRINQLVKEGRIRTLNSGRRGAVNPVREEDVLGYTRKPKGRPRAKPGQNRANPQVRAKFGFKLYQNVIYQHPTEFGITARVPVKILRFGPKRVLVEATDSRGKKRELWVGPEQLESKAKKGEQTMFFVKFQSTDSTTCALTICSPFHWQRYLKKWEQIVPHPPDFETFKRQFTVIPITKIMAARFSRFLAGKSFGKFPEYHAN